MAAWFVAHGLEPVPSEEMFASRAVGLDGRSVVTLGCTSLADFDASTKLTVSLDLSEWIDPEVAYTEPLWARNGEEIVYQRTPIATFANERTASQLFGFMGSEAAVMALVASAFGEHLFAFHRMFSTFVMTASLTKGVFTIAHRTPQFILMDENYETTRRIIEIMLDLDAGMAKEPPVPDRLAELARSDSWFMNTRGRAFAVLDARATRASARRARSPTTSTCSTRRGSVRASSTMRRERSASRSTTVTERCVLSYVTTSWARR